MRRLRLDRQRQATIPVTSLAARVSKHRASQRGHQHRRGSAIGNTGRAVTQARRASPARNRSWVPAYQRDVWASTGRLVTAATARRRLAAR